MPRRYGQHFLKDSEIARRIAEASGVGADDAVLEIGPGRGILTRELAARAKKVLAVEIDRRLHAELAASDLPPNVALRLGDALALDDAAIGAELGSSYALVSNLPYEITTATLQSFLTRVARPSSITLLIQKEVGERIAMKDGKANRLGLFCGYHCDRTVLLFGVPRGAFAPSPKVESCVIQLTVRAEPRLKLPQESALFNLIETAFASPRKKISNTLANFRGKSMEVVMAAAGIDAGLRPEKLSLEQWISLASRL